MNVIFISPVVKKSAQGRDLQHYAHINERKELELGPLKLQTRAENSVYRAMFPLDILESKYKTGLEELVTNPFYGSENTTIPESVRNAPQITLQTLYEIESDLPLGTLTSVATQTMFNTNTAKVKEDSASFIGKFSIDLFPRVNRFDDTTLRGKLAIQLAKSHPRIAPSKEDANPAVHYFYISEENESVLEANKRQDYIDNVIASKVQLLRSTSEFKCYQVAVLCTMKDGTPIVKGDTNLDQIKVKLNSYLDPTSSKFKDNSTKFMSIMDLVSNKNETNRLFVKYLLQQALNIKIMENRDGYIYWYSKSNTPNMGRHSDMLKLENLLLAEMNVYDATSEATNWYGELEKECQSKGIRLK